MENSVLARFVDPARMRVEVTTGSGQSMVLDGGLGDSAPSDVGPMEAVLAALAGCTSMDVASILRKKRQPLAHYEIAVRAERRDAHPQVFTRIVIEHSTDGGVEPEALRRSVELSATRYCPVNAMLAAAVSIEHHCRSGDRPSVLVAITSPQGVKLA